MTLLQPFFNELVYKLGEGARTLAGLLVLVYLVVNLVPALTVNTRRDKLEIFFLGFCHGLKVPHYG